MPSSDRNDKNNPNYRFTLPVNHTQQQVEDANKVVEIVNSSLSDADKSKAVYEILTNPNT